MKTRAEEILVITGPESSGKSTLAKRLSDTHGITLVSEFARAYLKANGQAYDYADLITIGKCQNIQEKDSHSKYTSIICDTDIITVDIWSMEVFDKPTNLPNNFACKKHYLLCKPDIPWEPDPLRENPTDRDRLFKLYEDYLELHNLSYETLDETGRATYSCSFINKH